MNVWLVQIGEPLPIDGEGERLMRTGILAQKLVDRGHRVYWWAGSFDHARLRQRPQANPSVEVTAGYEIALLRGRAYPRTVSLARVRNHREVADEFRRLAPLQPKPDIIVCSFPSIELALAASEYGLRHHVPVVIDIRDTWPDVMAYRVPRPLRGLAQVPLSGMRGQARTAFRNATAITAHAPGFVEWGLDLADRPKSDMDRDFPFGYNPEPPDPGAIEHADRFWDERGVHEEGRETTACFVGNIGLHARIAEAMEAARLLAGGSPWKFVFCGAGDALERRRRQARDDPGILFPGRIGRAEIWTLMRRSAVGLACMKDSPDFLATIPNKVPEYLSAGLPVAVNLSEGVVYDLLKENGAGFSFENDPTKLADRLDEMRIDPSRRRTMSERALALFHDRFVADEVYSSMVDYFEDLAAKR